MSVVIPTFNEAANLPHVLPALPDEVDELIIVDGHSTDSTRETALELCPNARVISQDGKGKGNALACGFRAARGDMIVALDADGSTDPREIAQFVKALESGADFVKGSRFMPGGGSSDISRHRQWGNAALGWLVNLTYGTRFTDLCYGYNAFWRDVLTTVYTDCDGFEVETVMNVRAARAGLNVVEVPSFERPRLHGASNLNAFTDGLRVLRTIIKERVSRRPVVPPVLSAARNLGEHPIASSSLPATRLPS